MWRSCSQAQCCRCRLPVTVTVTIAVSASAIAQQQASWGLGRGRGLRQGDHRQRVAAGLSYLVGIVVFSVGSVEALPLPLRYVLCPEVSVGGDWTYRLGH